jgi:cytochrome d ubiquinol oxidase subunit II
MTLPEVLLAVTWVGVTAYALLGGADFGGGFWDLLAGGTRRGRPQRELIEHSIGPVWEANHVWLVFALVVLWTAFPPAFAAVASTLYVPLTLAAVGIIARGAAFAFRKAVAEVAAKRLFGAAFALASVLTPFFLGTVAGAVASGRVPLGNARGDLVGSWWNPTSVLGGVLAVGVCAWLAAAYLTADAARAGEPGLAEQFRRRGLVTGAAVGAVALAGIGVLRADAPALFEGLTGRALPLVAASALAGVASLWLLWTRRFLAVRVSAALAVAAVVWGWAAGQYPWMLQGQLTIAQAAAGRPVLEAVLASLLVGALLFLPPLAWLLVLFQRSQAPGEGRGASGRRPRRAVPPGR